MSSIVEIKNISKQIRGRKIIDSLSFSVSKGEVFGLLGPNGAGKTTTIRMIVGLMELSSGDILLGGNSIKSEFEEAVKNVGAIVENPEMYKFLTGYENLLHYARMTRGVTEEKIIETIKLVGLEERINDKVKSYSLGMRQRLGIAQALLHDPKILVLDEPLNGLDPAGIREMRDHMRQLSKEKDMAIVISSHQLAEIEMICDRIAIIDKGKLINIQQVHDLDESRVRIFALEVNEVEKAAGFLSEIPEVELITKEDRKLICQTKKDNLPKIIKHLVKEDIDLFTINEVTQSLEDRFLEITKKAGEING